MRKNIILFICLLAVLQSSYASDENKIETGSVQGMIINSETKKPITNASFTATIRKSSFQREIVTDANGKFNLYNIPAGEHTMIIDRTGYRASKKEGIIIREGITVKIEFEMIEAEEEIHQQLITPITIHSF